MSMRRSVCGIGLVVCFFFGSAGTSRADFMYQVTVDTSSIANASGYIGLQFLPANGTAPSGTASVESFALTGGSLGNVVLRDGDAAGTLPGTITLDNGSFPNDVFQAITFGSQFRFDLVFSGDAVNNPTAGSFGSTFALSVFDSNQMPLLTTDPNGSILTMDVNPDGSVSTYTFPATDGGAPPVVDAEKVNPTPEPAALALLASSSPAWFLLWLRNRRPKRISLSLR